MNTIERKITFHSLNGLSDYKTTWELQEQLQQEIIDLKLKHQNETAGHLIFCEHAHVYTLGRFGDKNNLLLDYMKLQAADAQFFHIDRGGDITYHGPGQLVGYPILNLESFEMGVKAYIHNMEECIINMLDKHNIHATRLEGATGVWLDTNIPLRTRKICAIGVKVNRSVSMHGFALNVNTDLSYFNHINPCGFTDKSVTSMEKELGRKVSFEKVKADLLSQFQNIFDFQII